MKKEDKVLRNKHTEEIRRDVEFDLHSLMDDLLSAARATHDAARVGTMNLRYAAALGPDIERIGDELREAADKLRKIQAGVETLAQRAKEKD
ncbi:MAG TPA: hypothetical protein VFA98_15565 [Thermoanaerobaculia bacterium]|nr:hypothetical protein [Thermoanaerobaculia bacterium]